MPHQEWTESDIQSLKAQEAKDLAIEFLELLKEREQGPISPGEVQLRELEFELRVKQAEIEDAKEAREHERRIRELELQLEQERSKAAESRSRADTVRTELQELVDRVRTSEESLAVSLERATREHQLKLERLQSEHDERKHSLESEEQASTQKRDDLLHQIKELTELQIDAQQLSQARQTIAERQSQFDQERDRLDDETADLEFTKKKRVTAVQQAQELELARLKHDHEKKVMQLDREAADKILEGLGLVVMDRSQREEQEGELQSLRDRIDQQVAVDEETIRRRIRSEYNITTTEPVDVTALFYQHESSQRDIARLSEQISKLDRELATAREHIQGEPQRIAAAVEAARTPIQNIVEPATKR